MKSARRPLGRWRRNDRKYGGYIRQTLDGFEVIDNAGNLIAGPVHDSDTAVRWAHDLGVEVPEMYR